MAEVAASAGAGRDGGKGRAKAKRKPEQPVMECELPTFELVATPSRKDGISLQLETDLRNIGCELIQVGGMLLRRPQVVMACAQILFQRFFYRKSFLHNAADIVAMACLYLAAKVEEAPRRLRDVINVVYHIRKKSSKAYREGGKVNTLLDSHADQYAIIKNEVIKAERRILKELGFCVHVKHPHKLIVSYLNLLGFTDTGEVEGLAQQAWNYMNDALRTNVFVKFRTPTIACACIHLALIDKKIPMLANWWRVFDVTLDDIEEISITLVSLYGRPHVTLEDLMVQVDAIKKSKKESRGSRARQPNGSGASADDKKQATQDRRRDESATDNRRSRDRSRSPTRR